MRSQGREDTASMAFRLFDTDHDGFVTKEEFSQVKLIGPFNQSFSEQIYQMIQCGKIHENCTCFRLILNSNLKLNLLQVSKNATKEQVDAVFAKFDSNKDGKLDKGEFKHLMENKKQFEHISNFETQSTHNFSVFLTI